MPKNLTLQEFKDFIQQESKRLGLKGYCYFLELNKSGTFQHIIEVNFFHTDKCYLARTLNHEVDLTIALDFKSRVVPMNLSKL